MTRADSWKKMHDKSSPSVLTGLLTIFIVLSGCTTHTADSDSYPQTTPGLVACPAAREQSGSMPEALQALLKQDGLLIYTEEYNWLLLRGKDTFLQTQIQYRDGLEIRTYALQQGSEELFFALNKEPFDDWILSLEPQQNSVQEQPDQRWKAAVLGTALPGAADEAALADPGAWQKTETGYVYTAQDWTWEVSMACGLPACITTVYPDGRTKSVMIRVVSNAPDLISEAGQAATSIRKDAVRIQDPIPLPNPSKTA